MVKASSPLVVAAHTIRTSRADENTLPRRSVTASSPRALDRKRYRVGHPQISYTSAKPLLKIGKLTPIAKNDEAEGEYLNTLRLALGESGYLPPLLTSSSGL